MNLIVLVSFLLGHWVGDFVLQKNKLKLGKTKSKLEKAKKVAKHLVKHTFDYTSVLTAIVLVLALFNQLGGYSLKHFVLFYIITYITHFIVDFSISMVNMGYLEKNKRHDYFVAIGFDQFLHIVILAITLQIIYF